MIYMNNIGAWRTFRIAIGTMLTIMVLGGGANALSSDYFNSSTLNESLWTKVNPLNDSTFTLIGNGSTDNELLSIMVPSGVSHDVWVGNFAPRIMQTTDNIDFNIEVKFLSQPGQKYQMQGIIIEEDNSNFLRFDFYSDSLNSHLFAANFTGGFPIVVVDTIIGPSPTAVPIYMRVKREGNNWTFTYSTDGNNWIAGASFSKVMNVTSVGPFAGNVIVDPAPAFTGLIDYFLCDDYESPVIIGNTPAGTNVPVNSIITVTFNEMMNQTSAQSAFSTSPATTGIFSWNGNIMSYTPGSNFTYNTTYTATVGTGARDMAGNSLQSTYSWQFTSIADGSTLKSIKISPPAITNLTVGGSQLFSATAIDQNDNPITGIEVSWTVSNFTVGSVNPTKGIIEVTGGATTMFTALATGNAMVNATNGSFTGTAIVIVEKVPPSITFIPPTDPNNTILTTRNWTFINVSISESGSAWLEWNGVNESMSGAGTDWHINKTGLGNGTYTYRVWANDSAGNENVSETRVIEILIPSLKGDLNGNGISADAGDLVLMKRASIEEIQADSRYDLNNNGQLADAGDLVLMKRASIGEIKLV